MPEPSADVSMEAWNLSFRESVDKGSATPKTMECKDFNEGLATLAEGGRASDAAAHVDRCEACARRLRELRRLVDVLSEPVYDVPRDLTARAQALMRPAPRRLIAQLIGSSLAAAGARLAGADGFTLHVGAESLSVRLQYSPAPDGWEVLGRAPGADWAVTVGAERSACGPQGRFRIVVPSLERSAFALRSEDLEIEVPAARELMGRAS